MASYNELNALIDAYINRNGVQAITGQILNGVLKAMVEQLGRGYTIMGAATPATDPGTPDGPESWFASTPGTYTNMGGLTVANAELAILSYTPSDGWAKTTLTQGITEVQATIDANVGIPEVSADYVNGVLYFDFKNLKGTQGDPGQTGAAAGFGIPTATVDGNVGTPGVSVSASGPDTAKVFSFAFTNLKGDQGDQGIQGPEGPEGPTGPAGVTSVVVTVDNTSGNPTCTASLVSGVLTLAFTGLKGAQGDTGSSVAYPFTIVNNLTTDDATQALSAAMGVQLEGEITQLDLKIDEDLDGVQVDSYTTSGYNVLVGSYDLELGVEYTFTFNSDYSGTMYIELQDANGNVLITNFAASSFPVTKPYTPSTNISGAKIKIGHAGSGTVDVKVEGKGRLAKFDELYNETASKPFYKRESAATSSSIREKIDISTIPDGSQIIYHLTTLAGSSAISVALMNSDSTILTQYVPAQGDSFVIQKRPGMKYIRTFKGAISGNISNYEIKFIALPYKIDFRDSGAYSAKPFQNFFLGKWLRGYYYDGNINDFRSANAYYTTLVQFTSGIKLRVDCSDFSRYKVYFCVCRRDFSLSDNKEITEQTDIDFGFGYGWFVFYRRADYANMTPSEDAGVVSIQYLQGTITDRLANVSELREVESSVGTAREMDFFLDEFRTHPYIFHYEPNGLVRDGANNDLIGGQSEDGIRMAKRLGFRMIEANIKKTSDDKYVVYHGSSGNFGASLYSLDNTDITNVTISSKSLSWIKENVRFRSTVDKYKTPLLSIEEWCSLCRENGLAVLAGVVQDAELLPILQRMLGNNFILYNPPTNARELGFNGFCMEYKPGATETVDTLLQSAEKFGKPYMCSISEGLYNALVGNNTFDTLLYEMHKRGYIVGMSYINDAVAHDALAKGVDNIAAISQVNPFEGGEIYDINGDVSVFSGTGTIADNEATLATGETLICGSSDAMPLGKGEVNIRFNGSLTFTFGSVGSRTISSDGTTFIRLSDFFLRRKPQLTITATASTTITELVYKVKKC